MIREKQDFFIIYQHNKIMFTEPVERSRYKINLKADRRSTGGGGGAVSWKMDLKLP